MSMTPERIEEIKPYFTDEQLNELSREYRTMPTDGEGYVVEPEYEGMAARGNIVKLVFDVKTARAALEESQQQATKWKKIADTKILFVGNGNNERMYELHEQLLYKEQELDKAIDLLGNEIDEKAGMIIKHGRVVTDLRERLVEAQQTIARHEEALNGIIAHSIDKSAVDIASESMGYPEDENEEEKCGYCTGRPLVDREPLMKSQLSDYSVFINSANYLEDSVIGGSVPHSLYGVRIKFCPVCGKELGKS